MNQLTRRCATAVRLILAAEHDRGPLTRGQMRDLLADTTDWARSDIRDIVEAIGDLAAAEAAA